MIAPQEAKAPPGPSDEQRRTLWVGNIAEKVDEETLYELMINAGPVESIKIPLDPVSKRQKNFAFVRFRHEDSIVYAIEVFRDVRLFGKNLRMQNKDTGAGMPPPRPEWRPPQDPVQPPQRQHQYNHHRSHSTPQDFTFHSPLPVPATGPYYNQGQMEYQAQYQPFGTPPSIQQQQQQQFGHPMLQRTVENNYFQGENQYQHPDQVARDRHFRESRYEHHEQQQQHHDYQRSDSEGRNRSRRRDNEEHYRERSWDRRQRY